LVVELDLLVHQRAVGLERGLHDRDLPGAEEVLDDEVAVARKRLPVRAFGPRARPFKIGGELLPET
jgi:hypothetical protein